MRTFATHLKKSRHGIWYYRWVVPASIRLQHPSLPKEIKRSTGTADIRRAGVLARKHHHALLTILANGHDMNDRFAIKPWTVERDPATQRIVKIETSSTDTAASLGVLAQIVAFDEIQAKMNAGTSQAVRASTPRVTVWLSVAIDQWCTAQIQSLAWTDETLVYTHAPTLKLFRELISSQQPPSADHKPERWDMQLGDLDASAMDAFLVSFWNFPSRQGRRADSATGPEIVKLGGTPQSRANMYKRLGHIRQFADYSVDKAWLPAQALKEIDNVLATDTKKARRKEAASKAGPDGHATDGYIGFSDAEVSKLFGVALAARARLPACAAERYWIPLISLYSGLRVAEVSGLRPGDLEVVDGVYCLRVRPGSGVVSTGTKSIGRVVTTRMKTEGSKRRVPIHPKLIELGLIEYVQTRRALGAVWLWDLLWTDKDQFGKYPSLNFTNLLKQTGIHAERRKVFHSLRSTINQRLEKSGMEDSLRRRFLGHDPITTIERSYQRDDEGCSFPMRIAFEILSCVEFPVTVPAWGKLPVAMAIQRRPQRR